MIKILDSGKVFLDYGPISMVISAWAKGDPLTQKCIDAGQVAIEFLQEISCSLSQIKKPWVLCDEEKLYGPALNMWQAAKISGDAELTPMAAVAGAVADGVADWLIENGATKAIVNNGGDIALRLLENEQTSVGIVPQLGSQQISHTILIKSSDHIGGIATSGLGGRSFTRGVADSVTVFAEKCIVADIFATSLANASYINTPDVKQVPAETIDPNTDIPGLLVTVSVGQLGLKEKEASLKQIEKKAGLAIKNNLIKGVIAFIQKEKLETPPEIFKQ